MAEPLRLASLVERTYLTTGVLEAALLSWGDAGSRVAPPNLDIRYTPSRAGPRRPTGSRTV